MKHTNLCLFASALMLAVSRAATADSGIYWADYDAGVIQRADLDGSGVQEVLKCFPQFIALDLDARRMYWTDIPPLGSPLPGRIQRANLDGSSPEILVELLPDPIGIALQRAGGNAGGAKVLWTDASSNDIHRAELDGSGHEIVLRDLSSPFGIAVDAAGGKMYWTREATYAEPRPPSPAVQRANLDGSGLENLVVGLSGPTYGIALDAAAGRMYWGYVDPNIDGLQAGFIKRSNLDGSDVKDVVSGLYSPMGIALDLAGRRIYWTESDAPGPHGRIRRANLDGSAIQTLVEGLRNPRGIALDLPAIPEDGIDKLSILPPAPDQTDPITVEVSGIMRSGPVTFLSSEFTRAGSNLWLDINLELGQLTVMTPWSHAEGIGTLPPGSYELTARAISDGEIVGIRQISFNVIPEPASVALAGVCAALVLLSRRAREPRT